MVDVKPDVRQEDLKMLKEFDLHWEFGPCAGNQQLKHEIHSFSFRIEFRLVITTGQVELHNSFSRRM